jgi:hypothetical protein
VQAAASSIGKPAARVPAAAAGRAEQEVLLTLRLLHLEAVGGCMQTAHTASQDAACNLLIKHTPNVTSCPTRFHAFIASQDTVHLLVPVVACLPQLSLQPLAGANSYQQAVPA